MREGVYQILVEIVKHVDVFWLNEQVYHQHMQRRMASFGLQLSSIIPVVTFHRFGVQLLACNGQGFDMGVL